ncbi:MAG TPA: hypothetical protein VNQ90_08465 [Chthoniobacteraceae bacterium]|nr:hypothetical protein [Chthoniobacteraceae bacterium]
MSEIDPEKILAELEAARLARQHSGEGFPVRHRGLLITVAVVITLLVLALFVFLFFLGNDGRARPQKSAPAAESAAVRPGEVRNFSFALSPATS